MALSVKRFIHAIGCPEPDNQVNVYYHPTSADELCAGNGTLSAIFAEGSTLESISDNDESGFAGEGGICANGMDIVFVVDYTGSMGSAIDGVKTGLSNLVNTIDTESGGDYRLGLVIFDGDTNSSPNYALSGHYINLPSSQKINRSNSYTNQRDFITCMEKMSTVGNQTSFNTALNVLNATSNSSTGMEMGTNKEVGGLAIEEVVSNSFAGQWRSGVQRLIILVTDTTPEMSTSYFQNTIFPAVDNNSVQVMVNSSQSSDARYSYLSQNTQPAGSDHYGLDFNSSWTSGLETSITELCGETFVYTCDGLDVGWYQEVGSNTAYYWDGISWSNSHQCEYTVRINMNDSIPNAQVNEVEPGSSGAVPGYTNTIEFTGNAGTLFSYTGSVSPDQDFTLNNLTDASISLVSGAPSQDNSIIVYTDGGENSTSQNASLSANEFLISGNIQGDGEYNIVISGTTDANRYTAVIEVESEVSNDTVNPTGTGVISGTDFIGTSTLKSISFTGEVGDEFSFDAFINPNPVDYTLDSLSKVLTYTSDNADLALEVQNTQLVGQQLSETFNMPSGGGIVRFVISGDINQPTYDFTFTASENITGAHISSGSGVGSGPTIFQGYTGDEFGFNVHLDPDENYNEPVIGSVTRTGTHASSIINIGNNNQNAYGDISMPSGGGSGELVIATGSASLKVYSYTITIQDPYTDTANWQSITLAGTAGQTITGSRSLQNTQADTTYTVTGVSDDSSALTVTNTGTDLDFSLVMPSGGGSATVVVSGANTLTQYSYKINFIIPTNQSEYSWHGGATKGASTSTRTITVYGTANQTIDVTAPYSIRSITDYSLNKISVTESHIFTSNPSYSEESGTRGDGINQVYGFIPKVRLTMPSGGGESDVNCSATANRLIYTFEINASTDSGSSRVLEHTCVPADQGVTTTGNDSEKTITINGYSADTFNIQVPVRANNNTDYRSEINSWSFSPNIASFMPFTEQNSYCGVGYDYLTGTFTMPSLDSRTGLTYNSSDLVIDDTVSGKTLTFTLTSTDSISNVAVSPNDSLQQFQGTVGSTHNWTSTYNASSGYNFNITDVTKSGSNSGAVSVTDSTGSNIGGQISMPSGGGSATVTANGTSAANVYKFTVVFSENISNATLRSNGYNVNTYTVSLAPGESTTIQEYVDTSANYEFASFSVSDNSSNVSTSTSVSSSGQTGSILATVTMPSNATSDQSATITATGSTRLMQRSLTVTYRETISGAYIAYEGNISSGSGDGSISSQTFTGPIGSKGTEWNAIRAESGWENPIVSSVTDNSSYITSGSGGGTNNSEWADWKFNWEIPPTNQTAIITVGGTVSADCNCTFIGTKENPTFSGASDGSIDVEVGACDTPLTWKVNGVTTTPSLGKQAGGYAFNNLSAGTYTILLTDGKGCTWETIFVLSDPTTTTTTAAPNRYYYRLSGCNNGNIIHAFSDVFQYPIGQVVELSTGATACIMSNSSTITSTSILRTSRAFCPGCEGDTGNDDGVGLSPSPGGEDPSGPGDPGMK